MTRHVLPDRQPALERRFQLESRTFADPRTRWRRRAQPASPGIRSAATRSGQRRAPRATAPRAPRSVLFRPSRGSRPWTPGVGTYPDIARHTWGVMPASRFSGQPASQGPGRLLASGPPAVGSWIPRVHSWPQRATRDGRSAKRSEAPCRPLGDSWHGTTCTGCVEVKH